MHLGEVGLVAAGIDLFGSQLTELGPNGVRKAFDAPQGRVVARESPQEIGPIAYRTAQRADDDRVEVPLARELLEGLRHAAEKAIVVQRDDHADQPRAAGAQPAGLPVDAEAVLGREREHTLRRPLADASRPPVAAE